jgi:hypothetical protein
MTDLLLIVGTGEAEDSVLEEVARRRPRRVTVLVRESPVDWALDASDAGEAVRDRLAHLMSSIERDTGATVVGLAGDDAQLRGWRFDGVLDATPALAA